MRGERSRRPPSESCRRVWKGEECHGADGLNCADEGRSVFQQSSRALHELPEDFEVPRIPESFAEVTVLLWNIMKSTDVRWIATTPQTRVSLIILL